IISKTALPKAALCWMSHTQLATVAEVPSARPANLPGSRRREAGPMANGDEYKPKNLLSLLPDLAKQEIFDSMGNGYNAMDLITSEVAHSPPDHLYIARIAAIPACASILPSLGTRPEPRLPPSQLERE